MKKYIHIAVIAFLVCLASSCRDEANGSSILVSESDDSYKLEAHFDKQKSEAVQQYINRQISPNGLFKSVNDYFDVTTSLKDNTRFYIKFYKGFVKIKVDRDGNSRASYERIKELCKGVVKVLKD